MLNEAWRLRLWRVRACAWVLGLAALHPVRVKGLASPSDAASVDVAELRVKLIRGISFYPVAKPGRIVLCLVSNLI